MLIDSHHHLWKYSNEEYGWISDSVLKNDFLAPELREISNASGVSGFVSVQARQTIAETETLLAIAAGETLIKGVVGWVPLADPNVADSLDQFRDSVRFKGVRHVVQEEPDEQFLQRPDFNRGVRLLADRGLVYDLLIFGRQLPSAIKFARQHSNLPIVLDHIAKPVIQDGRVDRDWESNFRGLAKEPHVMCKFSGVVTEVRDREWNLDTIKPYWDIALEAFTPDRLMFGSDWPVCLLKSDYQRWLETVQEVASSLSPSERDQIFYANATQFYGLDI